MLHIFFIATIIRPTFVPSNLIEIMKKKNALGLFISIIVLGFTSCLDEDYFQEQFEKRYNKQWENIFGKMDPNHDWNIIQQVNATVQVSEAGEHTLRIYTDHPKNKQSRLIAQIPVEGTGTIRFDLEKISKDVYARVKDAQGKVTFEGYFAVNGGEVLIDEENMVSRLASRDATSGTSLSNATIINLPTAYRDGLNEYKELYGEYKNNNSNPVYLGNLYYFNNGTTFNKDRDTTWTKFAEDIIPIVNTENDYFHESVRSNRDKSPAGVEYVTIKEGHVELSYVYGATGLRNSFGYFYWTGDIDFSTDEGKRQFDAIPKIILMNNASPHNNLVVTDNESTPWDNATTLGSLIPEGQNLGASLGLMKYFYEPNAPRPKYIIGSKYSLVYFGPQYNLTGSYTFPKDVHIGFFLYTSYWDYNNNGMAYGMPDPLETNDNILKTIVYSIPQLNYNIKEYYDYRYGETKNDSNTGNSSRGEISAVTFQFHGQKLLGFEDGVDKDMNDIMLLVDADVEVKGNNNAFEEQDKEYVDPNPAPEEPEEPQAQSWIIACEDLGNTGDYDFNDAVFKVSHIAGSNQLTVTPLAAGGTYSIEVQWNGNNISKYIGGDGTYNANNENLDFHQLINPGATHNNYHLWQQINATSKGSAGAEITITDDALRNNFSITNHGFSVYVEKNSYASVTITQPEHKNQQAPQMLVLPEYWIWPYEGRSIHLGYSGFQAWTNNQSENEDWYTKPDKTQSNGYLVDYNSFSNYPNNGEGGGNSGGNTGSDIDVSQNGFPYYINGEQQNNLPYGTFVTIPASAFGNYGGTITFQSKNNLTIGFGGNGKSYSGNPVTIDIPKSTLTDNSNLTFEFWGNAADVQKISITTNSSDTGEEETPDIPNTIPLMVDNQQSTNLTVKTNNNYGYWVEISKSNFSASGATLTITTNGGETNPCLFRGDSYQPGDYDISKSNGAYTLELSADQINQISADSVKLYFWNTSISTVTGISITNKQAETGITLTVDNVLQTEKLSVTTNGSDLDKIFIPIKYFTGNNGASITFTTSNGVIINKDGNQSQQGGAIKENNSGYADIVDNKLELTQGDITYNNTNQGGYVTIFLPNNNQYGITAISITNLNKIEGGGISEPLDITSYFNGNLAAIPFDDIPVGTSGITITYNIANNGIVTVLAKSAEWTTYKSIEGNSGNISISKTDLEDWKNNSYDKKLHIENYNSCTNFTISAAN